MLILTNVVLALVTFSKSLAHEDEEKADVKNLKPYEDHQGNENSFFLSSRSLPLEREECGEGGKG